ncbi:peptidase M22 [Eubacteriaceae bacterium ES3]|nr:peptidase M22 [Eubacteriaceae bacterium ES3]
MCALSLGIDTSNYTTSVALVDDQLNLVYQQGILLTVKQGERGLRQSDALFQHIGNLPGVLKGLRLEDEIAIICCSTRPRPVTDSYMPVFKAGESMAESLSILLNKPLIKTSHQENHIRAAIYGSGGQLMEDSFVAVHFSGGTSEILWVEKKQSGYNCEIIAKTLDLNAGQLIDRVGVLLGLSFPAGREMEKLALSADDNAEKLFSSAISDGNFHFSGQENQAKIAIEKGFDSRIIALRLFENIATTLVKSIKALKKKKAISSVLFSGGVMSNSIIRQQIESQLSGIKLYFAPGEFSRDNAIGNALLGMDEFLKTGQKQL